MDRSRTGKMDPVADIDESSALIRSVSLPETQVPANGEARGPSTPRSSEQAASTMASINPAQYFIPRLPRRLLMVAPGLSDAIPSKCRPLEPEGSHDLL